MSDSFLWRDYRRHSNDAIQSPDLLSCGAIFEPYDEAKGQVYCYLMFAVREISAVLSLVSCCFVVFVIWLFKRYIFDTQRLILYLTLSALFSSLMYIVTELYRYFSTSNEGCAAFIFFLTFSIWLVIIWNLNITVKLFHNIVIWKTSPKWFEKIFILNSLVFPLVLSIVTILPQFIQDITFQCQWNSWNASMDFHIQGARAFYGSIWVVPSSLAFLFVIIAYITIFIIIIRRKIKKQDREISKGLIQDIKSLILYPVVILVSYFIPLLLALINLIGFTIEIRYLYFLILIAAFTRPLLGLLISLVYILRKDNYKQLNFKEIELEFLSHMKRTKVKEYPVTQMDHNFRQTSLDLEHSFQLPNESQVTNRNNKIGNFHLEPIPSREDSLENLTHS